MQQNEQPKLERVILRYMDGTETHLTWQDIDRMNKAADALDMIQSAKNIATRLSKL